MARSANGILGAFSGRIGPVVGCLRGDSFYIRSRPRKSSVAPTQKLLASRAAFKLVQAWLAPLKPVVKCGFHAAGNPAAPLQRAVGYALKHALGGEYPNQYVNPAKVKLSTGDLPGAEDVAVAVAEAVPAAIRNTHNVIPEVTGAVELRFSWRYDAHELSNPYDQVMLVACNTTRGEAVYKTTGNFRKDREDTLPLPDSWLPDPIHCWLSFIAADRSMQSESVWLGVVEW